MTTHWTAFGRDVRTLRQDLLDTEAVLRARELVACRSTSPTVLDLGCGAFAQSRQFALSGANVVAVDLNPDLAAQAAEMSRRFANFRFVRARMQDAAAYLPAAPLDVVYSQRALHYLRQPEALDLLRLLVRASRDDARFFIGVSGARSELGVGYEAGAQPIERRFGRLSNAMASSHDIRQPVCLYSEAELARTLESAGLYVSSLWSSAFGNIKAIAARRR